MKRFRRLRTSESIRSLVRETTLDKSKFIYPIFVTEGENIRNPVDSMPGIYQWSLDRLSEELDRVEKSGIAGVLLFGIPEHKDETASEAYNETA